ncbi:hypothetical protein GGR53DRAFT_496675 [Hypoxylon sp. FL1150]|nr:hypothetical protein GGR53DRAFT_496675 [Hypoxylon sp. FL1150]
MVSSLSTSFSDAYDEWKEANAVFQRTKNAANFATLWGKAEHALMLAGRPRFPNMPAELPRLLEWVGHPLNVRGQDANDDDDEDEVMEDAEDNADEGDGDDDPMDTTEDAVEITDIVEKTLDHADFIMWDCLRSQLVKLIGTIDEDDLAVSEAESI